MSSKQYNSPMAMYSEDVLEEIMAAKEGGKEADLNNPWNKAGKVTKIAFEFFEFIFLRLTFEEFDGRKSGVLAAIMCGDQGPPRHTP